MPLLFAVAGFFAGYLFAVAQHTWQDWRRAAAAAERLRAQRWNDLKATFVAGVVFFALLYLYLTRRS